MKKKIISFISAAMLLIPCLCINVFAQNNDITILNGGQNLQYKGNTYMRFDASAVYFESEEYFENIKYDTIEIKSADYNISKNEVMITAYFNYRDGSTLTASFIDQNHYDEYLSLTENANKTENIHIIRIVIIFFIYTSSLFLRPTGGGVGIVVGDRVVLALNCVSYDGELQSLADIAVVDL